ncbi:transcriptional regulator, MarR family [Paenibacillus sp. oral taxon 786 str. D14]|nr:transcriptional regulator, MarR family [Paenibacillus sp. oral taxon 786 str. D14]
MEGCKAVNIETMQLIERYLAAYFEVTKRLNGQIRDMIQEDVTMEQFQILKYIASRGRCTSTELADTFGVGKSSITAMTTRMVDKGVLQRTRDEEDRRVVYLTMTEQGERNYAIVQEQIMSTVSKYLVHFSAEEVEGVISAFEKLARLISEGSSEK